MPDWCMIEMDITGEPAEIDRLARSLESTDKKPPTALSFSRLIPMPLSLSLPAVSDAQMEALFCDQYSPGPVTFHGVKYPSVVAAQAAAIAEDPDAKTKARQYRYNRVIHGHTDWHGWCNENWGTKWDACNVECDRVSPHQLHYRFDTAWGFPDPYITELMAVNHAVHIQGEYSVMEEKGYFDSKEGVYYDEAIEEEANVELTPAKHSRPSP